MLAVVIAHLAAVSPVRTTVPRAAVRMNLFSSILGNAMPTIDYSTLAGRPSWGKEAGENALAGVIPTESSDGFKVATFAGGCFWGIELAYQRVPGVVATAVGYAQGQLQKPTYAAVCSATTGHTEAVQLLYDPKEVTYEQLCGVLMSRLGRSMFLKDQVGNDRGPQYRHGIYPNTPEQRETAEAMINSLQEQLREANGDGAPKIQTEIEEAAVFWPAEEYHQQYLSKGGRFGEGQSKEKGCTDEIRCYG